jgi:hypothetical protein
MEIIKIPFENKALPHGVVLGYDGENLTTEIQIIMPEIIEKATYWIELKHCKDALMLEKDGNILKASLEAKHLVEGETEAQLVWSWLEVVNNEEKTLNDKSNIAFWRVLDSVKLSDAMQEAYPEVDEDTMAETDVTDTYYEIIDEDTEESQDNRNSKYITDR